MFETIHFSHKDVLLWEIYFSNSFDLTVKVKSLAHLGDNKDRNVCG